MKKLRFLSYQFEFHAGIYDKPQFDGRDRRSLPENKKPVYVHCSEQKEVEECREKTGMTPIAYMDSLGLFENGGGLFTAFILDKQILTL